jgi:glutamine synthetase
VLFILLTKATKISEDTRYEKPEWDVICDTIGRSPSGGNTTSRKALLKLLQKMESNHLNAICFTVNVKFALMTALEKELYSAQNIILLLIYCYRNEAGNKKGKKVNIDILKKYTDLLCPKTENPYDKIRNYYSKAKLAFTLLKDYPLLRFIHIIF